MAINRFTGATNANWGTATNWSLGTVPTSADGHTTTFDATSPNCTVNTTNRTCGVLDFTGYTNTITFSFIVTASGNVTFGASMNVAGTSMLSIDGNRTITSNGYVWPITLRFVGAASNNTKTLADNLSVSGLLTNLTSTATINSTTSETITCSGGITASQIFTGSAKIIVTGGSVGGGTIRNDMDLQGTATIASLTYGGGSTSVMTYISGTISQTGNLTITSNATMNTAGVSWGTIILSGTLTITSLLTATEIQSSVSGTFAGTHGFTIGTLNITATSAITISFKESITYTVTSLLQSYLSRTGSIVVVTSSHASNKAILTLQRGATCQCLASFTRIDASGGRPIRTFNGVVTDCVNVVSFFDLKTVGNAL